MAVEKFYDVAYSTKSGRLMVAKRIKATSEKNAKDKLIAQMRVSTTFDKVVTVIGLKGALPKGMTKAIARSIKVTGLSKTTGRLLKGYKYKNGKPVKVVPKK